MKMSSEEVHEIRPRGGIFTRQQLEIIRDFLETNKLPSVETISRANLLLPTSSLGVYGRLKTTARRLYLINDKLTHVTGKVVIAVEDFIPEIIKAHEGLHLNFQKTLEKLSETFTIGRRRFGMSKRLIEAFVKTCNAGRCSRRKKKSWKQKEYEDTMKTFHKKYSTMSTIESVPTVLKDKSDVTPRKKKQTAKKRKRYSWVKGKSISSSLLSQGIKPIGSVEVKSQEKQAMPKLIQVKEKLQQEIDKSSTPTNKPETITIGPFPVSVVKNPSEPSQYQLGLLVPIVNQGKSLPSTSKTGSAVCIPFINTSTSSLTDGFPKNVNTTQISNDLKMLPFTTLLQHMAKNCQTKQLSSSVANTTSVSQHNIPSGSTFIQDPNRTNIENMMPNAKCHLPEENTQNKTGHTVRDMIKKSLQKQSKHAMSDTASNSTLPPKKKKKLGKQQVGKGDNPDNTDSVMQTVDDNCLIDEEMKEDDIVFVNGDRKDENNNEIHCLDESTVVDDDWSDENKALEYAKQCGMYRNCLKTLCGLQSDEFESVMDRMNSNIYSEGPFSVSFHMMLDPPYPHIWYFYHEIKQERNIFKRIMVVVKDIQIDMNRAMMQELLALDRLKRKMTYLESLIKKNKTYLDMCTAKSLKKMKKRRKTTEL